MPSPRSYVRAGGVLAAALAMAGACGSARPTGALSQSLAAGAPAEIGAACTLADQRCTRCHQIERVLYARVDEPDHWRLYVDRMRRQPGSGISLADAAVIVRCLVYRSFGAAGLRWIDAKEGGTP